MTRMLGFAAALAVFALGGYWLGTGKTLQPAAGTATTASKKPPKHCKGNDCATDVTVLWDCSVSGNCEIAVRDDSMIVKKGKKITWNVTAADYRFPDLTGITFADSGMFDCTLISPKQIECKANNSSSAETVYKYRIALVNAANPATGPKPPDLDPYVVNN